MAAWPPFAALGPEPLGPDFDAAHLARMFKGRVAPVKALLLDQRVVAGLGNIYVCEALYMARIAPTREGGSISKARLEKLAAAIREVLESAIRAGGSTIRCAKYATFGTQALSDHALVALEGRLACLLGQHGQISLGATLEAALWLAIEVATLSRMYVQVLTLGEPPVLPDDEMARVIEQMRKMSYGLAPDAEGINDAARARGG